MEKTKNKKQELASIGKNYHIKDMERDDLVVTPHGIFSIAVNVNDPDRSNSDICTGCFYKGNKMKGAPCVEGEWCGNLYSVLKPIKLYQK